MLKIETEEYIMYELGFLDGKDDTILKLIENKQEIEKNIYAEEEYTKNEWYRYGYEVATKYYFSEYENEIPNYISKMEIK